MAKRKTPKPGSESYDVENPQQLNSPEFNSSTDRRNSSELPALENMNDQEKKIKQKKPSDDESPKTNLGNGKRDENEDDQEKLITP